MKQNKLKFVGGSLAIVLTLFYLAWTNVEGNNLYSKSVADLQKPAEAMYKQRLTVEGKVVPGSIVKDGRVVHFTIHQKDNEAVTYPVEYRGSNPLPDLFRDRADVNVDGRLNRSGVFVSDAIAAKCASKYEEEAAAGVFISKNPINKNPAKSVKEN